MPDGVNQPRQYSLTRADDGEHRSFAVKRVRGDGQPPGEVSNLLHDSVDVGHRRGVPPSDTQYEVFGPDLWQADAD